MDLNVILRSGKYAGRTIGSVYKSDKKYINWILENRPEMLKSHGKKKPTNSVPKPYKKPVYVNPPDIPREGALKGISPNEAFDL
tara:strand:+ start:1082 stop:1333 length:252 start_codon:yes stop_codon:yes gene_type:complete